MAVKRKRAQKPKRSRSPDDVLPSRTPDELLTRTHTMCIASVKVAFGLHWTTELEAWIRRAISPKVGELLAELNRVAEQIRQLAIADPQAVFWDAVVVWHGELDIRGPRRPIVLSFDPTPSSPVQPGSEPLKEAVVDTQRLVERIIRYGYLCRCGETPDRFDGRRPCVDQTGNLTNRLPAITLADGTELRCASRASDPEIAAVSLLLFAKIAHFRAAFARGVCAPHAVLKSEARTIQKARKALGFQRAAKGRPSR
jgi:hypothetical protein